MMMNTLSRLRGKSLLLVLSFFGVLAVLVFRDLFAPDHILFMTDNNIGGDAAYAHYLAAGVLNMGWMGWPLLGWVGTIPFSLNSTLLQLLPTPVYVNWFHGFILCAASTWFAAYLLLRRCHYLSVILGALAVFWVGSNLTLTYSGHDGKYGVLFFASTALFLIEMAAIRKKLAWSILAGGAVGMMFVEQQDVALFIGFFLGAYALYALLRENGGRWIALLLPLALMGAIALMVGGPNVLSGYMTQVKGVVSMSDESPEQKWDFCTSWSLPPEDTLEFIAPGFRGIRTGEPQGPYWGRMGRTPGWEQTQKGYRNFKLNSEYEGAIPIGLALFAIMLAVVGAKTEFRSRPSTVGKPVSVPGIDDMELEGVLSKRRGDVLFWVVATVVALLLAFGRFFPLYSLFYQIPGMSSIRVPQKFLHVFQIGIGVLAAFGADALLRGIPEAIAKWGRRFAVILLVLAGILLLWTGSLAGSRDSVINGFTSGGWTAYAPVMTDNMIRAACHATVATLIVGLAVLFLVAWRHSNAWKRYLVMAGLILSMAVDVLLLSRHYIKTVSFQGEVGDTVVTSFLKENLKQQRVYMMSQEGFYNSWLMVLFPYHNIETFNVAQMPRMPEDYERWLKSLGKNPLRLWQLSAIGYVLAPEPIWQQIQKDPRFAPHFKAVKGFNVYASGTGVGVTEVPANQPTQHRILRFVDGLPRFKLYRDWGVVSDEAVVERLQARDFDPQSKVLVASDTATNLPVPVISSINIQDVLVSQVSVTEAKVTTTVSAPAVLMFVNKHSDDWRVNVNGKRVPLLRCNSVCLGVYLEPGKHDVRFYLRRQSGLVLTQMAGLAACVVALVFLWIRRRSVNMTDDSCKGGRTS